MKQSDEKRLASFIEFLNTFIKELNQLSGDGWVVLVEGQRDARAMRGLGYDGLLLNIASLTRRGTGVLGDAKGVIIMTDLDREGRRLAGRYAKILSHEGFELSLLQRRRLLAASRGTFRHVENLSRFAGLIGQ